MHTVSDIVSMSRWPELFNGPGIVSGNLAKVKVLHELRGLLSKGEDLRILDVGCVGVTPLQFWEPLLGRYRFSLTGVDVQGLERAEAVVRDHGWHEQVVLRHGSGYYLRELFAPKSFDVIIATQVLEHVAHLGRFLEQVAGVLRPGGDGFFTVDSAHWRAPFDPRNPVRLLKNLVKKLLSLVGDERHYDLPWFDHEVSAACQNAGLQVRECRYYNLTPLKFLHNHVVPDEFKNAFLRRWFELEESLNELTAVRLSARHLFMGFYIHIQKA